jgi:FkbM family methyltransferase
MRFYGQFDPPVDKILFDNYFSGTRGGTFIEAGASDGVEESCCKAFEESLDWRGVNVEPSPFTYGLLCQNRPLAVNVRAALSDRNGTATFRNALHPVRGANFGNGSLSHTSAHVEELEASGCTFEEFEVETLTYPRLVERGRLDRLDLFVLDVEGHELPVLQGMRETQLWPRVFCVEFGNVGLDDLRALLEPQGYLLDGTAFNNAYFSQPGTQIP